jgi:predicted transcriptional regulator
MNIGLPTVRMFMDRNSHVLSADDDILDALRRLISEGVTDAPVVDNDGRVVGVLSEYDCMTMLAKGRDGDLPRGVVREFMNPEFTAVTSTMDVYYVAGLFLNDRSRRRFVVIDGESLIGVITRKDILRAIMARLKSG